MNKKRYLAQFILYVVADVAGAFAVKLMRKAGLMDDMYRRLGQEIATDLLKKSQHPPLALIKQVRVYESALRAIRGPFDDPSGLDWRMAAYRVAGGGYEGLQAIANRALEEVDHD